MNRDDDRILGEAAAWHAASESDEMDWAGFTAWLEADARHRPAYDEISLADALLGEHRDVLRVAPAAPDAIPNDNVDDTTVLRPAFASWRRWGAVAIAASLIAVLVAPQFLASSPEIYETTGATRTIALSDGSTVLLAPHSRLTIDGAGQDHLALAGGAWFDIRHNPERQLAIEAGGVRISDIGTKFDVQSVQRQVRIEVAEGKVQVASEGLSQPIGLAAGKSLLFDGTSATLIVQPVAKEDVGDWRAGRLSYDSTPLALVAADLSRYAAVTVTVPDSLSNRRFSGTLVIGDGEAAIRDLSQVMGLELRRDTGGYRLNQR